MRIVNENHRTRRLVLREREDDDPRNPVQSETAVEFDERGRAEVPEAVGRELIDRFDPIREADGPEDVSSRWEAEQAGPWDGVDATDSAVELAVENGLTPDDVTGTGEDGRVLKGDVEAALSG